MSKLALSIYVVTNVTPSPLESAPPVLEAAAPPPLPLIKRGRVLKLGNKSPQTKRKKRQNSPERKLQRALRKATWPPLADVLALLSRQLTAVIKKQATLML
jgi:hypothetical protein